MSSWVHASIGASNKGWGAIGFITRKALNNGSTKSTRRLRTDFCSRRIANSSLLTLFQERQQHDPTIREFQRVVMGCRVVLVDLPEDFGLVVGNVLTPWPQMYAPNFVREGQLRPRT